MPSLQIDSTYTYSCIRIHASRPSLQIDRSTMFGIEPFSTSTFYIHVYQITHSRVILDDSQDDSERILWIICFFIYPVTGVPIPLNNHCMLTLILGSNLYTLTSFNRGWGLSPLESRGVLCDRGSETHRRLRKALIDSKSPFYELPSGSLASQICSTNEVYFVVCIVYLAFWIAYLVFWIVYLDC